MATLPFWLHKVAEMRPEIQPQEHQRRVADRVEDGDDRLLLFHGLGAGKSLAAILAAEQAKGEDGQDYAIAVPASLRNNFKKEVAKFTVDSTPEILSYTALGMGRQFKKPIGTLIADEAQRLRNNNTASSKALQDQAAVAKRLLLLSGTPIVNSPSDLAVPISMLTGKDISPQDFESTFIGERKVHPGWLARLRGVKPGTETYVKNERLLRDLLHGHVDYQPGKSPDGVDVQDETVEVPMTAAQLRIQNAVRKKIPTNFLWKLDRDFPLSKEEVVKLNAFMTGLRQSSLSTKPFQGRPNDLKAFDQSGKLTQAMAKLKETLSSDPRRKAIIYSNFIDAGLSPYAAALEREGIPSAMYHGGVSEGQRKSNLDAYNEGRVRALLIGPAGAEGLSARGSSLIQLLDPYWNEARTSQARGRGLRFDSHSDLPEELKNVLVQRFISRGKEPSRFAKLFGASRVKTGDEIIAAMAQRKEELNDKFRKILQEEGTKRSGVPAWLANPKLAAGARSTRMAKADLVARYAALGRRGVPVEAAKVQQLAKEIAAVRSQQGFLKASPEKLHERANATFAATRAALKTHNIPASQLAALPRSFRTGTPTPQGQANSWYRPNQWQQLREKMERRLDAVQVPKAVHTSYADKLTDNIFTLAQAGEDRAGQTYLPTIRDRVKGLISRYVSPDTSRASGKRLSPWVINKQQLVKEWLDGAVLTPAQMQRSSQARELAAKPMIEAHQQVATVAKRIEDADTRTRRSTARGIDYSRPSRMNHSQWESAIAPHMTSETSRVKAFQPHNLLSVPENSPIWYSGNPTVSAGYASVYEKPMVAIADESTLRSFGPTSPLHHHLAEDTRALSTKAVSAMPPARAIGNQEWAKLPNYEQVATMPTLPKWLESQQLFRPHPQKPGELQKVNPRAFGSDWAQMAKVSASPITVAGLCVLAADTNRVLMLQRADTPDDPAAGMWETPGGHLEAGESPLLAAIREWSEETGMRLPKGRVQATWQDGIYRGHVYVIDREDRLKINPPHGERKILNPDDSDGDFVEIVAWWKPEHLKANPSVRSELRRSMKKFQAAIAYRRPEVKTAAVGGGNRREAALAAVRGLLGRSLLKVPRQLDPTIPVPRVDNQTSPVSLLSTLSKDSPINRRRFLQLNALASTNKNYRQDLLRQLNEAPNNLYHAAVNPEKAMLLGGATALAHGGKRQRWGLIGLGAGAAAAAAGYGASAIAKEGEAPTSKIAIGSKTVISALQKAAKTSTPDRYRKLLERAHHWTAGAQERATRGAMSAPLQPIHGTPNLLAGFSPTRRKLMSAIKQRIPAMATDEPLQVKPVASPAEAGYHANVNRIFSPNDWVATAHEAGHAIDLNRRGQGGKLLPLLDAYTQQPAARLVSEQRANLEATRLLRSLQGRVKNVPTPSEYLSRSTQNLETYKLDTLRELAEKVLIARQQGPLPYAAMSRYPRQFREIVPSYLQQK